MGVTSQIIAVLATFYGDASVKGTGSITKQLTKR
jgi:hypothetical protein